MEELNIPLEDFHKVDMATLTPAQQEDFIRLLLLHGYKSKITHAYAENFLSVEQGEMVFDENYNTHALVGYNDSGKTAFTRIFDILYYDLHPNMQTEMIHDANGATHFKVGLRHDDGIRIEKVKRATGESIWYMYHNDFLLYSNSKDMATISVDGVPEMIKSYLKVRDVHKERINIRRNSDKLFLVHTNAGDNAKIIYTLLMLDNVTDVQKDLNKERNALKTKVSQLTYTKRSYLYSIERLKVMAQSEETSLEKGKEKLQNQIERTNLISSLYYERKNLETYQTGLHVEEVSLDRYKDLQRIVELRKPLLYKPLEELNTVDTTRLNTLRQIASYRAKIDEGVPPNIDTSYLIDVQVAKVKDLLDIKAKREEVNNIVVPPTVEGVNLEKLRDLQAILKVQEELKQAQANYEQITKEKEMIEEYSKQLIEKYNLKTCSNCGELSIMQEVG